MDQTEYYLQSGQRQGVWLRQGAVLLVLEGGLILRRPTESLAGTMWSHTLQLGAEQAWAAPQTGMHELAAPHATRFVLCPAPPGLLRQCAGWLGRLLQALMKRARNAPTASAGSGSQTR